MTTRHTHRPIHSGFETLRHAATTRHGSATRFPSFATHEQLTSLGMIGNARIAMPARLGPLAR